MGQQAFPARPAEVLHERWGGPRVFDFDLHADGRAGKIVRLSTPPPTGTTEILVQKQKLDCALQLARTVSLDFNNALTSILGHTSLLLTKAEADHPWRRSLMEVEKSAARAAEIANDLGTFSRPDKDHRGQQSARNLNAILQRAMDLFANGEGKKIAWKSQLERKLYANKFDEEKIQQAFVKVRENAV